MNDNGMDFVHCQSMVVEAARDLSYAVEREMSLEAGRAEIKQAAILRLMKEENPLTRTPEKPKLHAGTTAEAVVETDKAYALHLSAQRLAVVVTITCRAQYECAKARLWLAARLASDTQQEALR